MNAVDLICGIDDKNIIGGFTRGTFDLFVAMMANEQDVIIFTGKALNFVMHLGNQRAGSIDGLQISIGRCLMNGRRDTVSRKDDEGAFRDFIGLRDEDRSPGL